jgi:hypothetical protein
MIDMVTPIVSAMAIIAGKYMLIVNGEKSAASDTITTINHFFRFEKTVYGGSTADAVRLSEFFKSVRIVEYGYYLLDIINFATSGMVRLLSFDALYWGGLL